MPVTSGPNKAAHPPAASEWDYASICNLSNALRSRKISASELLEHTIARVEALDQRLNAIVVRDFDRAKDAAKAADAALARGEQQALLGIPVTSSSPLDCLQMVRDKEFRERSEGSLQRENKWQRARPLGDGRYR
jgi:hypothetical protein